ncbi:PadR family transcriptional regulator [Paracidobacterium acidisoli]|uniref:PadR family transcriptional regulator n=1 Tax=Paracidobacterium acidisoli TaxID=2303751 RepID=A0A372IUE5_9BACT|nr:PadR family transcriptional regulator [Paracidobacterium acidisoli]MBT9330033.1 PadR family transcriptional regulator [Paracidobacterium acidisoli]
MIRKYPFDDDLLENLPLPTASFFVLFALADADKHGYRIMQDIRELSGGTVSLGPATLYTTIRKLSDQGLISETSESSGDERRRIYALTSGGRRLLGAEFHRQQQLLDLARRMKVLKIGEQK